MSTQPRDRVAVVGEIVSGLRDGFFKFLEFRREERRRRLEEEEMATKRKIEVAYRVIDAMALMIERFSEEPRPTTQTSKPTEQETLIESLCRMHGVDASQLSADAKLALLVEHTRQLLNLQAELKAEMKEEPQDETGTAGQAK